MKEIFAFISCGLLRFTVSKFLFDSLGPFAGLIGLAIFAGGYMLITKESDAEYRERVEERSLRRIQEHPDDR